MNDEIVRSILGPENFPPGARPEISVFGIILFGSLLDV